MARDLASGDVDAAFARNPRMPPLYIWMMAEARGLGIDAESAGCWISIIAGSLLLGTVVGMIQAFNVIAFQTGAVKPILLASGISKAMITTATGLIVAIPAMIFYSYFRGKIQDVSSRFENISTELFQMITEK
jgi:biopolymer transport protein ExbB